MSRNDPPRGDKIPDGHGGSTTVNTGGTGNTDDSNKVQENINKATQGRFTTLEQAPDENWLTKAADLGRRAVELAGVALDAVVLIPLSSTVELAL